MSNDGMPMYPSRDLKNDPTIIQAVHQPGAITQQHLLLGPNNTHTTCPFCAASIKTSVKFSTTTRTHIAAALWCAFCCCLCCVPYAADSFKNTDHYCPNCNRYLGTYQK